MSSVGLPYLPRIDGYRAVAALLVVYHHYFAPLWSEALPVGLGSAGVNFFFVLSGFLITRSLIGDRGRFAERLGRFYTRRAFRILPLYAVALAAGVALDIPGFRDSLPLSLVYLNNFHMMARNAFDGYAGHFWTLAVEEQFYFLWPLLVLLVPRAALWAAVAAVGAGAMAYRYAGYSEAAPALYLVSPFATFDILAVGAAAALMGERLGLERVERWLRALLPAGVAGVAARSLLATVPADLHPVVLAFAPTAGGLLFAWLVVRAVVSRRAPRAGLLSRLGRISYGIYVIHLMVLAPVVWFEAGSPSLALRIAGVGATVGLAALSWRLVEKPCVRLGRRLAEKRAAEPVPVIVGGG